MKNWIIKKKPCNENNSDQENQSCHVGGVN
jgi:hypothetical protein